MKKIFSRMGDGWATELTEAELMKDIVDGSTKAADDAGISPLSSCEINHLFDIRKDVHKITGTAGGCEVITKIVTCCPWGKAMGVGHSHRRLNGPDRQFCIR